MAKAKILIMENPAEFCSFKETLKTKKIESLDRYEERFGRYYSIKSSPMNDAFVRMFGYSREELIGNEIAGEKDEKN